MEETIPSNELIEKVSKKVHDTFSSEIRQGVAVGLIHDMMEKGKIHDSRFVEAMCAACISKFIMDGRLIIKEKI